MEKIKAFFGIDDSKKSKKSLLIVWGLIIAGVVFLDQLSKQLVIKFLDRDTPFVLIEGVFRFKYSENRGAAFGSFDEHRWVFMVASIIGIVALSVYLFAFRPKSKLAGTSLAMIIGGGIGNMIDRFFRMGEIYEGEKVVVDFLDFYAFPNLWSAIFNVADSFVCIGAGLLILWCIISMVQESKQSKFEKNELTDATKTELAASAKTECADAKSENTESDSGSDAVDGDIADEVCDTKKDK